MSKELSVRYNAPDNLYEIYYQGGGEVPDELKGSFTSESVARAAIKVFQFTVQERVERNGKTTRGSRV